MAEQPHSGLETPMDAGSQALSEALRSSFAIVKVVMVILVLVFLASGFFTVGPQQRAIILRLGKPIAQGQQALLGPGLHWSLLYTADRIKVYDILTRDVAGFNDAVKSRATDLIEKQDLGVVVEQCIVQRIPPRQLRDAFDNVLRAEVNRSKLLNEARSYENQV